MSCLILNVNIITCVFVFYDYIDTYSMFCIIIINNNYNMFLQTHRKLYRMHGHLWIQHTKSILFFFSYKVIGQQ